MNYPLVNLRLKVHQQQVLEARVVAGRSGDFAAGQLDVQITSDVDLDELGQPHVVRHECEPLDYFAVGPVGGVNDTPRVQRSRFVAANRVLDVKQGLFHAGTKNVPVTIRKLRCSDESNLLLRGVEADRFQDQPILRGLKPSASAYLPWVL